MSRTADKELLKQYMLALGANMWTYQVQCKIDNRKQRHAVADMLDSMAETLTISHEMANIPLQRCLKLQREIVEELKETVRHQAEEVGVTYL